MHDAGTSQDKKNQPSFGISDPPLAFVLETCCYIVLVAVTTVQHHDLRDPLSSRQTKFKISSVSSMIPPRQMGKMVHPGLKGGQLDVACSCISQPPGTPRPRQIRSPGRQAPAGHSPAKLHLASACSSVLPAIGRAWKARSACQWFRLRHHTYTTCTQWWSAASSPGRLAADPHPQCRLPEIYISAEARARQQAIPEAEIGRHWIWTSRGGQAHWGHPWVKARSLPDAVPGIAASADLPARGLDGRGDHCSLSNYGSAARRMLPPGCSGAAVLQVRCSFTVAITTGAPR